MIEVTTELFAEGTVGLVRFSDGERNHLSPEMITQICDAYDSLQDGGSRAIVLSTHSRHFCAGADFSGDQPGRERSERTSSPIYDVVPRLFARRVPVVAVVDGAAIGGGLGLAMSADFRVAGPTARFSANFARIGMSQGFGLTHTLQQAIGKRAASRMLYTGGSVDSQASVVLGLSELAADTRAQAEEAALSLAGEIARSAPLAINAVHALLNPDIPEIIRDTLRRELSHQRPLYATDDFREGVLAARERRGPHFSGS